MIKGKASKHFMEVISHSLGICLTSMPSWHLEASLLIINRDLTKEGDEVMKYISGLTISMIISLMDYRGSCHKMAQSLLDV